MVVSDNPTREWFERYTVKRLYRSPALFDPEELRQFELVSISRNRSTTRFGHVSEKYEFLGKRITRFNLSRLSVKISDWFKDYYEHANVTFSLDRKSNDTGWTNWYHLTVYLEFVYDGLQNEIPNEGRRAFAAVPD